MKTKVTYDSTKKGIEIKLKDTLITMSLNEPHAIVNDQPITLTQSPMLVNNHTYVPLRFISETLCATVDWDQQSKSVRITYLPLATQFMLYDSIMRADYATTEAILQASPHLADKAAEIVAMEQTSVNFTYLKLALDYGADPIIPFKVSLRFEHEQLIYYLLNKEYIKVNGTLYNGGYSVFGFYSPEQRFDTTLMIDQTPYIIDYLNIQGMRSRVHPMLIEYGFKPNANDAALQLISTSKYSIESMQLLLEQGIDVNSKIGKVTAFTEQQELYFIQLKDAVANHSTTSLIELAAELALYFNEETYLNKLELLISTYDANVRLLSSEALVPLIKLSNSFSRIELEATLKSELERRV